MTTHHRLKCLRSGGRTLKLPTKHTTVLSKMFLRPDDGIGIRTALRKQVLRVRVSLGAPK